MKKLAFLMICLFAIFVTMVVKADNEKPIPMGQLPLTAQKFVKKHFADRKVLLAKMETEVLSKNYEVTFEDGTQIDFDSKGNWETVDCHHTPVPTAIIPAAIVNSVETTYPDAFIMKIEKDKKKYEVELSNHIELTFDQKFQLKDIDR